MAFFSPQRLATCAGVGVAVCAGTQTGIASRFGPQMPHGSGGRSMPPEWYAPLAVLDNWKLGLMYSGCYWLYAGSLEWEKNRVQALKPGLWKEVQGTTHGPPLHPPLACLNSAHFLAGPG